MQPFKTAYRIATPQEAAQYIREHSLMGRDNWMNRHRFQTVTRFISRATTHKLLDFGCGNGFFLQHLHRQGYSLSMSGYDPYLADDVEMDAEHGVDLHKSFDEIKHLSFDIITALDVIEHIEDDITALQNINSILKPNGEIIITVPSYQWLYNSLDAANGHYRRYTKTSMQQLLTKTGFTVIHQEYFFIFLIPVSLMVKLCLKAGELLSKDIRVSDFPLNPLGIFSALSRGEHRLSRLGVRLPCGYCLLTYGRKATV